MWWILVALTLPRVAPHSKNNSGNIALKQLEKIKGDGRVVLLPPNSMCTTQMGGGEAGGHAHRQVQSISG